MSYLPTTAWRTIIRDVFMVDSTTYEITVARENPNDPGALTEDVQVGYYVRDYVGHTYTVSAISLGGDTHRIRVTDDLLCGVGPANDFMAFVYQSVGGGSAPYIGPIQYRVLDQSAIDYARPIELDILWKNLLHLNQVIPQTVYGGIPIFSTGISTDFIDFNKTPTGSIQEGRMMWDATEITPVVGIAGGYSLPLLKSLFKRVKNDSGGTLNVGDVVYISGSTGATFINVKKANASAVGTSYVLGMVFEKAIPNNQFGIVVEYGFIRNINTLGLSYGIPVWLATTDGGFTQTRPDAPNTSVFIGYVVRSHATEGSLVIRPTVIPRLTMLSDVYTETPSAGEAPVYNNSNGRFELSKVALDPHTHNYQPLDADLTAIAGLSGTSGLLKKTAADTWALDTSAYLTSITKAQVEAVLTGAITTHTHNYQPLDADLTAIAGLSGTSGLLKKTAADTWVLDGGIGTWGQITGTLANQTDLNNALGLKADLVNGIIPSNQLPSYVDDVLEYSTYASLPTIGESGKIYVTLDSNLTYRWTGSAYTEISKSLALGTTSSTAFRGDYGNTAYDYSQIGHLPLSGGSMANTSLVTNMNADLLDGNHGSYYDHRLYNVSNYLGAGYNSGGTEKPNWFGAGKLQLQMLSGSNIGAPDSWNDVLWMSGYTGGDVKLSNALIFSKYGPRTGFVQSNFDSTSWGTYYTLWNSGNDGSGSGLDADLLDGQHLSTVMAVKRDLINNENLDNIKEIGSYVNATAQGSGNSNFITAYGIIDVTGKSSAYGGIQKSYTAELGGELSFRMNWNGWSPWRKVWDDKNSNLSTVDWNTNSLNSQHINLQNGGDLNLSAPANSEDSGDIVFYNGAGVERHRIFDGFGYESGTLAYRTNAGAAYKLLHSGNAGLSTVDWTAKTFYGSNAILGGLSQYDWGNIQLVGGTYGNYWNIKAGYNYSNADLQFSTKDGIKVNINSDGNVGIGYTSGSELTNNKLAVNGTIYSVGTVSSGIVKMGYVPTHSDYYGLFSDSGESVIAAYEDVSGNYVYANGVIIVKGDGQVKMTNSLSVTGNILASGSFTATTINANGTITGQQAVFSYNGSSSRLAIYSNAPSLGTGQTYPFSVGRYSGGTLDFTIGSDSSYVYFQSWNSMPILVNSQGNAVIDGQYSSLGAGTTWNTKSGLKVTKSSISAGFTLTVSNLVNGMQGDIILTVSGAGPYNITLSTGATNRANGTLTGLKTGTYHMCFTYDGTYFDYNVAKYT